MKDLDIIHYFISQSKNIDNIIERDPFYDTRETNTPLELNVKYDLSFSNGVPLSDLILHRTLIDSLMYPYDYQT